MNTCGLQLQPRGEAQNPDPRCIPITRIEPPASFCESMVFLDSVVLEFVSETVATSNVIDSEHASAEPSSIQSHPALSSEA